MEASTTVESAEESTTTIDSCDRLNRRAGAAGGGCGTTTTTTSNSMPTVGVKPGASAQNLELQVSGSIPTPISIKSLTELRIGFPAGYKPKDSIHVLPISNLGGVDKFWGAAAKFGLSKVQVKGSVLKEIYVAPKFLLKHLAGIRPTSGQDSSFNSVIPSGASIKMEYYRKSGDSHDFKATII